ncbi:phage terminase large subunit [Moraxella bovis]|uniref:Phage terminase large subunit n=1 Tax=Moraxella bovis TaxID=476 RepID=A0A378PYD2_MORBO|nr:phage terminase large subunit [Moraxella bovis]UYZ69975.1 phage terminase large subunit [Moraxella bovis]UZA04521.1 phage terminase large subunit [Moraxella bovis]UZA28396.1 phage terminase large subunit [Moraxella bovis]UZA39140.1 phage terminase large subunit [Moraxella bovis]STY93425.1 Transposase and inactivated derivatives [Moraxella bovis]
MLSEKEKEVARSLAYEDLYFFSRYMFYVRYGYEWVQSDHHQIICDKLTDIFYGRSQNVIINIPPRYSKTELAVVNFIAWSMGRMPDCEFIHSSYSSTLASKNSSQIRDLICHEEYQKIFNLPLKDDSQAKDHWKTQAGGTMYATGAGGTITGFGAGKLRDGFGGAIIIDDPHKATEARSETKRNNVINWFTETIKSRKNTQQTPIIVIMQRLHENDLSGFLLSGRDDDEWEHLCLPAISDDGKALWDFKHDIVKLRQMEQASPYMFAGQYQQRPAPLEGGFFKPSNIEIIDALPTVRRWVRGWDLGATVGGDPTCGALLGIMADGRLVIGDMAHGDVSVDERDAMIKNTASLDGRGVLISLPQDPGQAGKTQAVHFGKILQGYKFKTSIESGDKVVRAEPFASQVNTGNVVMVRGAWNMGLVDEMRLFPNASHDDRIDALSRAYGELISQPATVKYATAGKRTFR